MNCRVIIQFRDKEYSGDISYAPSNPMDKIPPYILNSMSQENPKRYIGLRDKAYHKQIKQKEFILNGLTGKLGELIVKDFLQERGFRIRPRFNPGDYSGENKDGEYIIEVKTVRGGSEGIRLRRKQITRINSLAGQQGKKPLFYVCLLRPVSHIEDRNILNVGESTEIYTYRVQVIRCITLMYRGKLTGKKTICINRKDLFSYFKKTKYPCYYHY